MKETKKTKRHIGIDLHSDTFTACFLQEGAESEICTLLLKGGLDRLIAKLRPDDEIAVEATGNSRWFRARVRDHVARVVVVAPGQFEVIRRSVKKTDKNDAKAIAFFLGKGMLPEARVKSKPHAELADAISMHDQMTQQSIHVTECNASATGCGTFCNTYTLSGQPLSCRFFSIDRLSNHLE